MVTMTDQEILESNIIAALHLETLPDEHKIQLLNNIATLVQKRSMAEILNQLNDQQQTDLDVIIQESGPESEQVAEFLKNNVTNMEEIITRELIAVKRDLIEKADELEEKVEMTVSDEE